MGQSTSSSQIIASDNQSHERLGVIKVFEASDMFNEQESFFQIELKRSLQSEEKYQRWLARLRQIDSEQARDVLYLPVAQKFQKTAICGSSGELILTFEYFPYVLKTQIRNRRKMSQYFQQTQLWYLLYNLVEAGTIFERRGQKIGDIHPNNCLLNQNGQFKVITHCSLPDQTTNYQKIVQSPTNDAYLAPEEIDPTFLEKGVYPHVDQCRAQIYSMGMTLLQAATLQDCFYTYSRGPYKVNKKKLGDLLKIVKDKYSKKLYDFLSNMLDEMAKRRKPCSEIFAELYPYEDDILCLREWTTVDTVTKKVGQGAQSRTVIEQQGGYNVPKGQQQSFNNLKTVQPQQIVYQQNSYGLSTNQFIGSNQPVGVNQYHSVMGSQQNLNQNSGYQFNQQHVLPQQKSYGYNKGSYSLTSIDNTVRKI